MSKDNINVCLMNDSFPPLIDGVVNVIMNYANIITNGNGSATVVTPAYPDVEEDNYPFPVVRYTSMPITEGLCGYRMGYPFSSSKLDLLKNSEFDLIHSHCPFASTVMGRVLREKTGLPIVLTYHTKFDIDIRRAFPTKVLADATIKLVVGNIAACDEVWTVSNGAGENLRSLGYEGDYVVMENGVDFPCGRADPDDVEELRSQYGFTDGAPVFLFVGRLLWYKGLRLTLDALKILKEKGVKFHMLIVGDGSDRAEIEAYVEELKLGDSVVFAGAVYDREDLRVFYTAGDLFVFPSQYDTNGIVVREAAACGVGSLLIEGSCAAEGIIHGRTGILTKDDPAAIAEELIFAAEHLDEIHQIGQHAMEEIYISWDTAVKKALDRYQVVIENVKSGNSHRKEGFIAEDFFLMMSALTNTVQRFRSVPTAFKKTGRRFGKKLKRKNDDSST